MLTFFKCYSKSGKIYGINKNSSILKLMFYQQGNQHDDISSGCANMSVLSPDLEGKTYPVKLTF
jgi:hypothetical protein